MTAIHDIDYGTPASESTTMVTLTIDGREVSVPAGTVNSTPAMMPIVFWASFAPWFRLKSAADTSCSFRNQ